MAIFLNVLTTTDMYPEVAPVGGLDDGLVEVRVGGQELKPTVEDVLVRMGSAITPLGVLGDRDVDVGCFTQSVL